MNTTLGVNDRVNKTLGICIKLKILFQSINLITQILSVLANGVGSVVETLDEPSFHMRWVFGFEVEVAACMSGLPVDLGGHCLPILDNQYIQKGNAPSDSISIVNWMEGLRLLRWLRKVCNRSGS
jgi:hypothetical protein